MVGNRKSKWPTERGVRKRRSALQFCSLERRKRRSRKGEKGRSAENKGKDRKSARGGSEEFGRRRRKKGNDSSTCGRISGVSGQETPDDTGHRRIAGSAGKGSPGEKEQRCRRIAGPTGEEASGERRRHLKEFCCGSLEEPQASADSVAHWWFGERVIIHFLYAGKRGILVVG